MRNKYYLSLIILWLPVASIMAAIFYFSGLPSEAIPEVFIFQDIVFHLSSYCLLALFFGRALNNSFKGIGKEKIIIFTFIFALFYGISDEFHQYFVPGRDVSLLDVICDMLGGFLGALLYTWRI